MNNKILRILGSVAGAGAIVSLVAPLISFAQAPSFTGPGATLPPATNITFTTISGALCTAVAWIFTLLVILTVIFILFAAYNYLSSGGEEEKIKEANHQLLYAAICLIVAILSRAVPTFVGFFLNTGGTVPIC